MHKILRYTIAIGLVFISRLVCAEPVKQASPVNAAPDLLGFSSLIQLTLGMFAVLTLIMGLAWLLKRSGRFQVAAGGSLKILGGLSMGTRERVVLLQVGDKQLLVGVAPGSIKTLHVLDTPLVTGNQAVAGNSSFAKQLGAMLGGNKVA